MHIRLVLLQATGKPGGYLFLQTAFHASAWWLRIRQMSRTACSHHRQHGHFVFSFAPHSPHRQVTLRGPADIQGSVSLRGEEDAWWGRAESSLLAAVLAAGGYPQASADEFFFQVGSAETVCGICDCAAC